MFNLDYHCQTMWDNMNRRVRSRKSYLNKGIKVLMSRTEFFCWHKTQSKTIMDLVYQGKTPSLNRKDHTGHYEISNIEIQDLLINGLEAKDRRRATLIKSVTVVTPTGLKMSFSSIVDAARHFGLNPSSLRGVHNGSRRSLHGYKISN